jgi:hypothetical protein
MKDETQNAIDHLTYASYAHNRRLSPNIPYYKWFDVYGKKNVLTLESIYQAKLTKRIK